MIAYNFNISSLRKIANRYGRVDDEFIVGLIEFFITEFQLPVQHTVNYSMDNNTQHIVFNNFHEIALIYSSVYNGLLDLLNDRELLFIDEINVNRNILTLKTRVNNV